MAICVYGLWHLGTVTAACAAEHFSVVACDSDAATISGLAAGRPPVFEPGLSELLEAGVRAGRLSFSHDVQQAVGSAEIVWVTLDTPVDVEDVGDSEFVRRRLEALFPYLANGNLVLISSQVPVGFTARLEAAFRSACPDRDVSFAYSPENLRLGKALDAFRRPSRVLIGVRKDADGDRLRALLSPFCDNLICMSVESAEMTKHALNSFLAVSISYINEVAALCELTGADARQVAQGLKSEPRIGERAYLNPGAAFAGGTLARDVMSLTRIGAAADFRTPLLAAVMSSNNAHKTWPLRKLQELLGDCSGKTVAVLGLTYRPGTDTLRRSSAVELCLSLAARGANVRVFDPAVRELPAELAQHITPCATASEALRRASAMVVCTELPEFRSLRPEDLLAVMAQPLVVDPGAFLESTLGRDRRFHYVSVGRLGAPAREYLEVR